MFRLARLPYQYFHPHFRSALEAFSAVPPVERFDELAALVPRAPGVTLPKFVTQRREALREAGGYEHHVFTRRAVPTRPGHFHDFFNMCVWAHFPRLRWALNALHVDPPGEKDPRNGRTPVQNRVASLDETGLLVVTSSAEIIEDLRELRFKRVFWERRAELAATTRFWIVGHGLLESLLWPHPGLAAKSLLLHWPEPPADLHDDALRFAVDAAAAAEVDSWRTVRVVLDPVPVLAIPGYSENDSAAFYDDRQNIPFDPCSRRPVRASG